MRPAGRQYCLKYRYRLTIKYETGYIILIHPDPKAPTIATL